MVRCKQFSNILHLVACLEQIRKEFSQVAGQIADVDLKGSSLLPPPIHSDAFPRQHSKQPQTKPSAASWCDQSIHAIEVLV